MNPLFAVLPAIFAAATGKATPHAAAVQGHVNEGIVSGPIAGLFGTAVQTPRGLADINLEGFSEDLDQDGFVDPIAPAALRAAPVAVAHAPLAHAAPLAATTFAANPAINFAGFPSLNSAIAPLPLAAAPVEVATAVDVAPIVAP